MLLACFIERAVISGCSLCDFSRDLPLLDPLRNSALIATKKPCLAFSTANWALAVADTVPPVYWAMWANC